MIVYIVRHAIAIDREEASGFTDGERPLTPRGVRRMHKAAAGLRSIGAPAEIWTSPLVRARQTADILQENCGSEIPVRLVDALAPGGDFDALVHQLADCREIGPVAMVGHEPDLGEFGGFLLTGRRDSFFQFKKGGIGAFEIEDFGSPLVASLVWFLMPGQLRRMR